MSEQHENATPAVAQDENQLIAERREKLKALRQAQAEGKGVAFPNDFKPEHHAQELHGQHGETCLLYTSPSPRDTERSRMPSSA